MSLYFYTFYPSWHRSKCVPWSYRLKYVDAVGGNGREIVERV